MGKQVSATVQRVVAISPDDGTEIDLRDPAVAAALSWLVPGLGQLWQGRRSKGLLFLVAIGGILLAGLWFGGGKVAYCLWSPGARRIEFIGQAGIGAVAVPAVIQSWSLATTGSPLLPGGPFVPPLLRNQPVSAAYAARLERTEPGMTFVRDPTGRQARSTVDELSVWYLGLGRFFDIGTLYVTIAGLLNLLAVYDAWAGPLHEAEPEGDTQTAARAGRGRRREAGP